MYVMYAGKVMEQAETFELFGNTQHPYTKGLLKSIPRLDGREKRLYTIEGVVPNLLHLPRGCNFSNRCGDACGRCMEEKPDLYETSCGHKVRCFLYERGRRMIKRRRGLTLQAQTVLNLRIRTAPSAEILKEGPRPADRMEKGLCRR